MPTSSCTLGLTSLQSHTEPNGSSWALHLLFPSECSSAVSHRTTSFLPLGVGSNVPFPGPSLNPGECCCPSPFTFYHTLCFLQSTFTIGNAPFQLLVLRFVGGLPLRNGNSVNVTTLPVSFAAFPSWNGVLHFISI